MPDVVDFASALLSQPTTLVQSRAASQASIATRSPIECPGRVGIVAMGAAHFAGTVLEHLLIQRGVLATNTVATDFLDHLGQVSTPAICVLISESGRSPEPVEVARRLTDTTTIGVTNCPDSPLGRTVDVCISTGGVADSPVYVTGYTGVLVAFDAVIQLLGLEAEASESQSDVIAQLAITNYERCAPALAALFSDCDAVDVVGHGAAFASASELALMLREATRTQAAAFETYQYLHGPLEGLGQHSGLVVFGDGREISLAATAASLGVETILVTAKAEAAKALDHLSHGHVVGVSPGLSIIDRAVTEIVFAQQLIAERARLRDLTIGEFTRHQDDTKLSQQS